MNNIQILNEDNTLLIGIDIQEKLLNAAFNKDIIAKNSGIMAKTISFLNLPAIFTEQYPKGLGSTIESVKNNLPNDTKYIEKNTFSALNNEEFIQNLSKHNRKQIVIFGIETHICVYQTIIDLLNKDFEVSLIADISGSRSEIQHNNAISLLKDYGVKIKTTEMVLFELLKSSKHEHFKEIQNLIK